MKTSMRTIDQTTCLTRQAYTYGRRHCHGRGWELFDEKEWPNIQRIDELEAFPDDAHAALHVLSAAAFDAGAEGEACRAALRTIVCFGERGLNPIATMLLDRRVKRHPVMAEVPPKEA